VCPLIGSASARGARDAAAGEPAPPSAPSAVDDPAAGDALARPPGHAAADVVVAVVGAVLGVGRRRPPPAAPPPPAPPGGADGRVQAPPIRFHPPGHVRDPAQTRLAAGGFPALNYQRHLSTVA